MKETESTEEQILVAAFNVFVEKGFENTKMQDIADQAGIKRTVLNYYFRTKELLYKKIAKTILKQALPNMLKILNSDLPFEQKIEEFVENYINLGLKNPHMPLFIINELNHLGPAFIEEMLDGKKPEINTFIEHVKDEMKKGNIIAINPVQVPLHIVSLCAFPIIGKPMVKLITNSDEKQYNELIQERKKEVVRFVLKGLKP
ncbi:MAG TPA: TetR/AcrR family transcriptional regulator [Flavobacterium sp.]|nr:TetR/AcrR family transcriptional regulator [Flavobacterium sp.]